MLFSVNLNNLSYFPNKLHNEHMQLHEIVINRTLRSYYAVRILKKKTILISIYARNCLLIIFLHLSTKFSTITVILDLRLLRRLIRYRSPVYSQLYLLQ